MKEKLTKLISVLPQFVAAVALLALLVFLWVGASSAEIPRGVDVARNVQTTADFTLNPLLILSFTAIAVVTVIMIAVESLMAGFSLHLAHWIFVYVFFCAAPLVQYRLGFFPWRGITSFDTQLLLLINVAILIWMICWILARLGHLILLKRWTLPAHPQVKPMGVWISVLCAFCVTALLLGLLGIEGLLTRANYEASLEQAFPNSAVSLIVDKMLRAIPVVGVVGSIWYYQNGNSPKIVRALMLIVSLGLLLISNFPLGAARYWAGAVYLGLLLTVVQRWLKNGWIFVGVMVTGLIFFLPSLSTARYATSATDAIAQTLNGSTLTLGLARPDYDAYSIIGYTLRYVLEGPGPQWGTQLLGTLLFFIPRSLWPGKPVNTGEEIAGQQDLLWQNVSSPLLTEGLIDFGWLGIILFAIVASLLTSIVDATWQRHRDRGEPALLYFVYPFFVGFMFFILRGSLLAAFAYTAGMIVAFLLLTLDTRRPSLTKVRRKRQRPTHV